MLVFFLAWRYEGMIFYQIVQIDYDDCKYEAGYYEEVPGDTEHAEYGGVFDEGVVYTNM